MQQKLTELRREINKSTIIVGDSTISRSVIVGGVIVGGRKS